MRTLCIGNQTHDTDDRTTKLARENNSKNLGLVTSTTDNLDGDGYWHTSLADIDYTSMLVFAQKFDQVYFLDQQDINDQTYKLFQELASLVSIVCERAGMFDHLRSKQAYWHEQFKTNLSICVKPFITTNKGICSAIGVPVSEQEHLTMKQNMILGVKNSQCESCYAQEGMPQGFQPRKPQSGEFKSQRISESLDWIGLLDLQTVDDLLKLRRTYYYRMNCKELNSIDVNQLANPHTHVDIVDDCILEFFQFLKRCVQTGATKFVLTFTSNTADINNELLAILDNFSFVTVKIKLDAASKANNYIHWGTDFNQVLTTAEHIKHRGHKISFVSKVSIYNIAVLNELLEFFDDSGVSLEIGEGILSPYNFTDKKQIINVLDKCKETNIYKNNETIKKVIDGIYKIYYVSHYQRYNSKQSIEQLELFFKYTDSLDESRGSKLKDYIPELDAIRRVK